MISAITKLSVRLPQKFPQTRAAIILVKRELSHTIESKTYEVFELEGEQPAKEVSLELEDALSYYKQMQLIRKMENGCTQLYMEKHIRGFLHLYAGEEACCVGVRAIMQPEDTSITSYRCHGWAVAMGENVHAVIAELMAKVTGNSRGKGGSMHIYYKNFYGGSGIVGAHVPVGTGLGFAHKYKNNGAVSFTVFGDGATNQGQVHESFNLAKLHNLPVVFVIENNQFGMGTSINRSSASTDYFKRGCYIPGIRVDGMDLLAVREAARFCREYVLKSGPIILEFVTYRYFGHSMSDPGKSYRTQDEVKSWRDHKDPIKKFKARIVEAGLVKEEDLKKIEKEAKLEVEKAIEQAKNDKHVDIKELGSDCYVHYSEPVRLPGVFKYDKHQHFGFYKATSASITGYGIHN